MAGIKAVVVDDSSFSVAFIKGILEENGFEVVGEAGSLEEVKKVVAEKKPTLVTMDMTLPGTDGLECTRAIHEIDENIRVIVISSMMDAEIVQAARENKVCAYLQKPVDADALITAINRIMANEELFHFLEREYFAVFKEALLDGMNRMTKTLLTYKDEYVCENDYKSKGMTVIIGIIGEFCGRMLIDLSKETAGALASAIYKKPTDNFDAIVAVLGEFANIISGSACSILNRKNKALGLRVAPPSILYGDRILVSAPDFQTMSALAETECGPILLNTGFKRGGGKWI